MQKLQIVIISILVLLLFSKCTENTTSQSSQDQKLFQKADSIISLMTLEEKVGQMLNIGLASILEGPFFTYRDTLIFDSVKVSNLLIKYGAGSVQNLGNYPLTPSEWRYYIGELQKIVKNKTRLGIPLLYGIDAAHGANYTAGSVMFPHQINMAASFNTELVKEVGKITSYELKASAIPWNYAPVLDVARQPMWGRIYESFGEDTYVVTQMGAAIQEGAQGDTPWAYDKTITCAKHFLGYGASYTGKDRSPVIISENYLRQVLLPPFEKAIDNGLLSLMISSGTMNGIPSHIDYNLLTNILKKELGFKGFVISDWGDIDNLHKAHKVAKNEREAVKLSVLAGLDMCMEPYDESFAVHLIDLVNSGEVPMSRIDDAVRRILYVKLISGVFIDPLFESSNYNEFASEKSDSINHLLACESITLLKNDANVLPLKKGKRVLVTGVAANSINYLNGGWSRTWSGQDASYNDWEKLTIFEAIQQKNGKQNVIYAQGTGYTDGNYIKDAVAKARNCDVIVVCVGEKPATEIPSDINELELPEIQQELVKQLAAIGKPIVLVMVQGRPRIIRKIEPLTESIIMAYLPGNEGGRAIADVLYGDFNPCGKLPYTYPRYSGALLTYDHLHSDEHDVNFGSNGFNPQYEFGYGLSYANFKYADIILSSDSISVQDTLIIKVNISNTGTRIGKESVLLFVSDEVASVSPPVKQLKKFKKNELKPGETNQITFTLNQDDLKFINQDNEWVTEPGYFTIKIGSEQLRFYLYR